MGEDHDHKHSHGHGHDEPCNDPSHDHEHKHEHKHDHGHSHSHEHGEDCDHCDDDKKVTTADSVAHVPVPEWKKKALAAGAGAESAPFGGSWNMENSMAIPSEAKEEVKGHDHGHSHEHMEHPGK